MKVTHAVARFLQDKGIRHVFSVSGGANLHLLDAISMLSAVRIVCPQGEQAASFAADAYARFHGLGCAVTTCGPGATNLITGIATSFYDGIPVLYITGDQTRERMGGYGVRQYGFQATPIVEMVKPITKYAVAVMDPEDVLEELEKAVKIATTARKGPVLVDIPDDIQRAQCKPNSIH